MATDSTPLSAEHLSRVVSAVKDCMREEIQSLKRELVEEKEAAEDRIVKRAGLEEGPTFKKKSHENSSSLMHPSWTSWGMQMQLYKKLQVVQRWIRPKHLWLKVMLCLI